MITKHMGVTLFSTVLLSGCMVTPTPFLETEIASRVAADQTALFDEQEPVSGPISVDEAIARALKYNLDNRLKLMEDAVGMRQLDVANVNLLPNLAANAGYNARSAADATFNQDRTSTSTSSDRQIETADLHVSWNVLDFAIGYMRARQQADRALIVQERRRQVVQNIMQETRAAYWRAAAAERTLRGYNRLLDRVRGALASAERQASEQVNRMDALVYQRQLLETLRELERLRREMASDRSRLAVLMNIHPDTPFTLTGSSDLHNAGLPTVKLSSEDLELVALRNRSELRSEAYQLRITQEEARIAILRMVPGLNFSAGINYTSDSFKDNQDWFDGSMVLSWQLMNLVKGPTNIRLAEAQQQLSQVRRLALSMAVIAQVNVAQLRYSAALRDFNLARRLNRVEQEIFLQARNSRDATTGTEAELVGSEVRAALARLNRNRAYADVQAAFGRLVAAVGADPLVTPSKSHSVSDVAAAIKETLSQWQFGNFAVPLPEKEIAGAKG